MNRRGAGLLELVMALALSLGLVLLAWGLLATAQARLRDRSERAGLTHALRVAEAALRAASAPLGAELAVAEPDRLVARVVRARAVACGSGPAGVVVRTGPSWWQGVRAPVAGRDSLLAGTLDSTPRWISASLSADPRPAPCLDGTTGLLLPAPLPDSLAGLLGAGSPVQLVEPVELRLYSSGGAGWIGARQVVTGESVQPIGRVAEAAGGAGGFEYLRRDGTPAVAPGEVGLIRWRLSGESDRTGGIGVSRGGPAQRDSLQLSVLLRNAP